YPEPTARGWPRPRASASGCPASASTPSGPPRSRPSVPDPGLPLQAHGSPVLLERIPPLLGGLHHLIVGFPLRQGGDLVRVRLVVPDLLIAGAVLLERRIPLLARDPEPFHVRHRHPELHEDHDMPLLTSRPPVRTRPTRFRAGATERTTPRHRSAPTRPPCADVPSPSPSPSIAPRPP